MKKAASVLRSFFYLFRLSVFQWLIGTKAKQASQTDGFRRSKKEGNRNYYSGISLFLLFKWFNDSLSIVGILFLIFVLFSLFSLLFSLFLPVN